MPLPATGRGPDPGLPNPSALITAATLLGWQQSVLLRNLPLVLTTGQVSYPPGPGTLPEQPLGGPVPIAAENLGLGVLASFTLLGRAKTLELLNLARKAAIYSGHPGFDAAFWFTYLRSTEVQRLIGSASAEVLSTQIPVTSPIIAGGILQQQVYRFASQAELDQLFDFGKFGDLDAVQRRLDELRADPLANLFADEPNSVAAGIQQRIASIEAGIAIRPLLELRQLIAQGRYDAARLILTQLLQEPPAQGLPAMPMPSADP